MKAPLTATIYQNGTRITITVSEKKIPVKPHVVTITRTISPEIRLNPNSA